MPKIALQMAYHWEKIFWGVTTRWGATQHHTLLACIYPPIPGATSVGFDSPSDWCG